MTRAVVGSFLTASWAVFSFPASAAARQTQVLGNDPGLAHLAAEVERLAEHAKGTVGVAAYHLETGRGITLHGDVRFPMASTYKVPIATRILSMVDRGELSLSDMIELERDDIYETAGTISDLLDDPGVQLSVHNLLELMLQVSDNNATDVLFRTAGGAAAITGTMAEVGADIRVDRPTWAIIANWLGRRDITVQNRIYPDEFLEVLESEPTADLAANNLAFNADPSDTATPAGMATLLRKIWDREILSEESSALLIDIMYRCQTGEGRLKGALPPGTRVAHKTGTIGETTNDVGIIDLPGDAGHVVTVVYIKESKLESNEAMEPVIAQIARAVHDYFVFNRGEK
jgi:beta-lactamase class A